MAFQDYPIHLSAGVKYGPMSIDGDYYQVMSASGPITFIFDSVSQVTRNQGQGGPAQYRTVYLLSASDQDVVVTLGALGFVAPPYDSRAVVTGGGITLAPSVAASLVNPTDVAVGALARVNLLAADPTRRSAFIRVPASAVADVRIGNSTCDATHGAVLHPDDAIQLTNTSAIYAYNTDAVNPVTLSLMVETLP